MLVQMKTMWPGRQNLFDEADEILDVTQALALAHINWGRNRQVK